MKPERVVIIGANFSGLSAAGELARNSIKSPGYEVCIVDPVEDFEWTPNIHEILSGIKKPENLNISRQQVANRLGQRLIKDQVVSLNPDGKIVQLKNADPLHYDVCIIACGHRMAFHQAKGVIDNTIGFRHTDEVLEIKSRLNELVSQGGTFTVSLVGGGYSGIEALGELLRKYRQHTEIKFQVIEQSRRLLNGLPEVIAEDVMQLAAPHNVEFVFNAAVSNINETGLTLSSGRFLPSDLTIWAAGTELPSFLTDAGLEAVRPGGILTGKQLQLAQYPEIFVAGDAATFSPALKKQAYHALDMGAHAARNVRSFLNGEPLYSFQPVDKPIALAFGDLNTYLIQDHTVFASPVLAAAKEVVYQLYMAQLSSVLPLKDVGTGIADRFLGSVKNLLIPEVSKLKLLATLRKSRVLQWGEFKDMETMARAMLSAF